MKKKFLSFYINVIYLPLAKLSVKFAWRRFKKLKRIQNFAYNGLHFRIKNIKGFKIYGYNEENDELVFFTISDILDLTFNTEDEAKLVELKTEVSELKEIVLADSKSQKLIYIFFEIQQLINDKLQKTDIVFPNYNINEKNKFDVSLDNINNIAKNVSSLSKNEINEVFDRSSFKLKLSYTNFLHLISIVTPLILIGAYLSNKIYFSNFNIDIHNFFNVSDYISISIAEIELASISVIFASVSLFLTFFRASRNQNRFQLQKRKIKHTIEDIFILIILFAIPVISFYINSPMKYYSLSALLFLIVFKLADVIAIKYFSNPIKASFFIIIILSFISNIIVLSYSKVFEFKLAVKNKQRGYELVFKDSENDYLRNQYFLGSNSHYIFLIDSLLTKTTVIDKNLVQKIELDIK
jgi:hypothetical protein